jgi:thioredoxin 1
MEGPSIESRSQEGGEPFKKRDLLKATGDELNMGVEAEDDIATLLEKRRRQWEKERAAETKGSGNGQSNVVELTDANFDEVLGGQKLMLVDFWAPWCGPCRWVSPILEEIARENAGKLVLGKMNVDENPRTSYRFGIQGIPTILISREGNVVDRIVGAAPKETLMARIAPHIGASVTTG